jgi:two-component system LytT family response regulator
MNTFRTIIVDDEPLARKGLELRMRADPEIRVVANCADGRSAIDCIREFRPDVVFLDVDMPQLDGFAVLGELDPLERPRVVFVAPNEQHAVRAFDVSAVDYLLTPYSDARFATALARVKDAVRKERAGYLTRQVEELLHYARGFDGKESTNSARTSVSDADPLVLKSGGALHFIKTSDVVWIEAQGDFVKVQTGVTIQLVRETLQSLEQKLDAAKFLRIHRSFIVNLDHVSRVKTALYGDYSVYMSDGTKLRLSRNYRGKLKALANRVSSWRTANLGGSS